MILGVALLVLALVLVHYRPTEGYVSYEVMTSGWDGDWWEDPQHAPVSLTGRGLREEVGVPRRVKGGNPHASKTPMLYGIPQDLEPIREGMDVINPRTKDPMLYGIPQDLEPIREGMDVIDPRTKDPMLYGIPQDLKPIRTEGFATYSSGSTQRRNAPLRYGGPTDLRYIEGMDGFSYKNKNPMLYGIPQDLEPIREKFIGSNDPAPLKYQGPSDLYAFRDIKNKMKGVSEGFATCGASGLTDRKEGFATCGASGLTRRNGAAISEGFATHATDARRMPACVNRSTDAQSLLARIAHIDSAEADELRLLMSKLCCMEADIAAPGAGTYRTLNLQFRTSQDTEPPVAIVSRCLVGAVNNRDTELIIEKFKARGHELIRELCNEPEAVAEFDTVLRRLELTMMSFCVRKGASMDRPAGPRDPGYWASEESDLSQYKGFSAEPK